MKKTSDIEFPVVNENEFPRETKRHYISASEQEIEEMMEVVGVKTFAELYRHIGDEVKFSGELDLPEELDYRAAQEALFSLSQKNKKALSFIGDGLPDWKVPQVTAPVCAIRKLATSYTPYQPERSQGTLMTQWIYQCLMSQLTEFEAVNSSLYERSTAIFEAICCASRLTRGKSVAIVPASLYPGDREVLQTSVSDTHLEIIYAPTDETSGLLDLAKLQALMEEHRENLAAVVYAQVNGFGLLEDVDAINDAIQAMGAKAIAVIDPILLAQNGLKPPTQFGANGADMFVGEAQHLAIGPNFGGPGLGVFGTRFNDKVKNDIRNAPGRFIGKALDETGRICRVMVLSTREQHIRKDKATSNICSNQAFLATLAGAALLERGDAGLAESCHKARHATVDAVEKLTAFAGVTLAFPTTPFFNEIILELNQSVQELIAAAQQASIHLGVDVSDRLSGGRQLLKLSFSDRDLDIPRLEEFFAAHFAAGGDVCPVPEIPVAYQRKQATGIPQFPVDEIVEYYRQLGELNLSPDDACYPLGSCTMKYNPYLNEWAAGLEGFTNTHPQAPYEDVQGNLELLYETQEWFKGITGLAGVTTQPVAGAQGELVGIKMFQAYHRAQGDVQRDIILIPKSAHGTNFATATMAGFVDKKHADRPSGIVLLEADESGIIDLQDLRAKIDQFAPYISGIMVTNPNTGGVFETEFKQIADWIHEAGGLVYMDGANMNAICGWVDLGAMGVDAVHNNLHKTWTIPHGGGGPGDAIVAVSEKLLDYLPGYQIEKEGDLFVPVRPAKSIGSFHRHWGNFAHKIRCYSYLLRLGKEGVRRISGMAVLSSRYLFNKLTTAYPVLPVGTKSIPRMHEFILTLTEEEFTKLEEAGIPKAAAIPRVGKAFLDFGYHAPTVAFPEVFGLMIEPTESYSKVELDRFADAVMQIKKLVNENPQVLLDSPHYTPIDRVDEVTANRKLQLFETFETLPEIPQNRRNPMELLQAPVQELYADLCALVK